MLQVVADKVLDIQQELHTLVNFYPKADWNFPFRSDNEDMDNPTSALFRINSIMRILLGFHHHYRKHCHRVDDQEKPEEEGGRSTNSNWI